MLTRTKLEALKAEMVETWKTAKAPFELKSLLFSAFSEVEVAFNGLEDSRRWILQWLDSGQYLSITGKAAEAAQYYARLELSLKNLTTVNSLMSALNSEKA